jgi:hypothetical protein
MFFNADILLVYANWQANGVPALELCLGLGLLVVGVVLSYALVRYELAKTNVVARKNDD